VRAGALAGFAGGLLGLLPAAGPAAAALPAPVVLGHRVEARIDVPESRIDAVDVVRFAARPGEPVRFLLHRDLEIRSIRSAPGGEPLEWRDFDRWFPRHFWRRPPYDELDGFEVAREVEVSEPAAGWGGIAELAVEYGGVIADSLHAPDRAYGRSFETTSGRIVEEGAYLTGGTFWVPWSGEGLFPFELTTDVPEAWRSVSQGVSVSDVVEAGRRVTRWVAKNPTEGIYLIAGPYRLEERDHAGVRVQAFVYADTGPEVIAPYLETTGAVLDRYSERYGPYPYGKFALVENYWQTGYGMPSFTFLGNRVIRLPFIVDTSYPHEILHNWWGNGVYLRSGEGNWCEGLTTYGADYAAKEAESAEAARDYRRSTLQGYRDFAVAGGADFPLLGFRERDSAATQAVGYGKTLFLFHMLRSRVGDAAFNGGLRRFFEDYRFRRAGWDDLRASFETETGEDLSAFFGQWVERAGAPTIRLQDVRTDRKAGTSRVSGVLVQNEPVYELAVPVVVLDAAGASVDTLIACSLAETPFTIDVPFAPARVAADPDFGIFRVLHAEESPAALSAILGAPAVRIVLGADTGGDLRAALKTAAEDWARDSTVTLVEETGGEPLPEFDGGTWFFGVGPAFRTREALLRGVHAPGQGTLVAAAMRPSAPGDDGPPLGFFLPEEAGQVASIARKIPHYSKYSWLRFEGDRNVEKSLWDPGLSPLTVSVK
jgi:hypothetical protein